jgi:hypothetical protein
LFAVASADINGRQNARGRFVRVFRSASGPVRISAPAEYGQWKFEKWTDRFGGELPSGPFTNPVLDVNLANDSVVAAQYILSDAESLKLSIPAFQGGLLTLRWKGGPGTLLQTTATLHGNDWRDVAGSEGKSELTVPVNAGHGFFRVSRP